MPKFGQAWFAGELFGDGKLAPSNYKNSIHRVPLGFAVRKVLRISNWRGVKDTSRALIFQMRRGNGYHGSILGELYQQKVKYKVPWPNGNPACATAQALYAESVYNWKHVLSDELKAEYNERVTHGLRMSGYNLYIREHMKGIA